MKSRNLFAGVLILFTGVIALLAVMDVFEFHWSTLWRLWPMFLIIMGIALLPFHEYVKTAILLIALALGCWLYHVEDRHYKGNPVTRFINKHHTSWDWDDWDDWEDWFKK